MLRGCRLMSLTNAQLAEFVAFKCANAVGEELLTRRAPPNYAVTHYERALRFNLSGAEKSAVVEMLGTAQVVIAS